MMAKCVGWLKRPGFLFSATGPRAQPHPSHYTIKRAFTMVFPFPFLKLFILEDVQIQMYKTYNIP